MFAIIWLIEQVIQFGEVQTRVATRLVK